MIWLNLSWGEICLLTYVVDFYEVVIENKKRKKVRKEMKKERKKKSFEKEKQKEFEIMLC